MFDFTETTIPGLLVIRPRYARDPRGTFVKTFHHGAFTQAGLTTEFRETYYSASEANVVRGMHFQLPPHDHAKLVYCAVGRALDVVLDLRVGSPGYGRHLTFEFSAEDPLGLHIPKGCAHGFVALTPGATLLYAVETVYAPNHDAGIRWNSFGCAWPVDAPILSPRDEDFPTFADFDSPFRY